jgi:GNAT superfamily N-acetyltransferase
MSSIAVRSICKDDFPSWIPLWNGYNAFYGRTGPTALSADITAITWSRFFDSNEPVHAVVAESDGKLIGLAHYLFHRSTTSQGDTCYMQDLFTDESARGLGAGRALIEEVYRRALAAGCPGIYWHTHATNATARALYDKVADMTGFIVYRKRRV